MREASWDHPPKPPVANAKDFGPKDPLDFINFEPKRHEAPRRPEPTSVPEVGEPEGNGRQAEPEATLAEPQAAAEPPKLVDLGDEGVQSDRSFRIKRHGMLDDVTLEALLISAFLRDADTDGLLEDRDKEAETVFSSAVRGEWFTNRFLGSVFDTFRDFYRGNRSRITPDETAKFIAGSQGQTQDQANALGEEMHECLAARLLNRVRPEYLVEEMTQRYRTRTADRLYQEYVRKRKDPKVGPSKAIDDFRIECMQHLTNPAEGDIVAHDWIGDFGTTMASLKDMKLHPEKYSGFKCGITAIDDVTKGFRPGHLTVFVGAHGGFKTTTMINVGYGLWANKYNVLYASFETEAELMEIKLWCRATRAVSFSKAYSGLISESEDWQRIKELGAALEGNGLSDEEKKKLKAERDRLQEAVFGIKEGNAEMELFRQKYAEFMRAKNKFYIVNAGQSNKVRPSQLERWLKEMEGVFRPDVVIVDYLDLVAPETPYPDRRDQELGDICKYFRQMGKQMNFSVITAAQLKRAALDRMRKSGPNKPEKFQLGTDDIAGSHMIGADADEVIMLFREDGGNRIRMFVPKSRHGTPDVDRGKILQVDPDTCTIEGSDAIEDTSVRSSMMGPQDAARSMAEVKSGKYVVRGETDDLFAPEDMKVIFGHGSMGTGMDDYDEQVGNAISSSFEPKASSKAVPKDDGKKIEDM
jgi:replicative DNA helicase